MFSNQNHGCYTWFLIIFTLIFLIKDASCNTTIQDLISFNSKVSFENVELSTECKSSIEALGNRIIFILDANAKIPSGILNSNTYDLGSYDECYYLKTGVEDVFGKYCLGQVTITIPEEYKEEILNQTQRDLLSLQLYLGYCLPSTCSTEDFNQVYSWANFDESRCASKAIVKEYDASDVAAISVFSVIAALVVLCTTYDVYLYYTDQKPIHYTFTAFSLWTNCQKLFKTSSGEGQLSCINGFKALSMIWVVFGHSHSMFQSYILENIIDVADFITDAKNMYMLAAPLSVDTFFAIGGILTIYTFFKAHEKGVKFNVILFYIHRYLRLTPALMAMILYQATLVRYAVNRPGSAIENLSDPCRQYWWSTILYIQNYVEPTKSCVGQSWYLMVDMQLFVLTPLVLIPFIRWPKQTLYALCCLAVAGCVAPFIITYDLSLNLSYGYVDTEGYFMRYYYIQTYARFGPYVIGMIFGYFIYLFKSKPELVDTIPRRNLVVLGLWIFALAGLAATSYGGAPIITGVDQGRLSTSIFNALFRNGWAVCCCVVIALCSLGFGGPINGFLSIPMFQFLSKISYSIYIVHITLIYIKIMNTRIITHFSEYDVIYIFLGDFMVSVFVAFFFCAVFESPIIILEKFLFGGFKKTKPTIINEKQ